METKEITDTERLDFIEKNFLHIQPRHSIHKWCVYSGSVNGIESSGYTLKEAIDAAMRRKDV